MDQFVCFGGFRFPLDFEFGQEFDPFAPANPMDIWTSPDGASWSELTGAASPPWSAAGPEDIKYDFAAFASTDSNGPVIYTFGGDRETFDPEDTAAFEKVDNDVWVLSSPE